MKYDRFFWLHIKKSAGTTTRELLQPYYKLVDRVNKPYSFIQASPDEYNDVLNNYRVVLGKYQFKRALFAKTFLYPDDWNSICSFAFVREPVERCVSMYYALHHEPRPMKRGIKAAYESYLKLRTGNLQKAAFSTSYDFDLFLDLVEEAHFSSENVFKPIGLHFTTHTASMFGDITDYDGNVLLSKVYRLEELHEGISEVYRLCGLQYKGNQKIRNNKSKVEKKYIPNSLQIKKIQKLYKNDFELYESRG